MAVKFGHGPATVIGDSSFDAPKVRNLREPRTAGALREKERGQAPHGFSWGFFIGLSLACQCSGAKCGERRRSFYSEQLRCCAQQVAQGLHLLKMPRSNRNRPRAR